MIRHVSLGDGPFARARRLKALVDAGAIVLAGNRRLKIYGRLDCVSGRQMKAENRVFFAGAGEAAAAGYRPCGHCMPAAYRRWRERPL
ncbi:metal-binding protein [Chitinophaga pendula]|uniref:Ada metal-binding domain-containing protein n=1 Tax=Chitinophaga TaxID=79328 RepID=UPI000BB0A9C6|nr:MULTISPECIES: Ada metal-binding domain-containing protein [Chitinophaga]ASZ12357.1 metal-binding protein [Chitinophaga sp. MD30]UCJ10049.1 metal-binding protein [Chitinophaga pendula]